MSSLNPIFRRSVLRILPAAIAVGSLHPVAASGAADLFNEAANTSRRSDGAPHPALIRERNVAVDFDALTEDPAS